MTTSLGYHQSQNRHVTDEHGNPIERMLVPIPGQVLPTIPIPNLDGN